MSHTPHRVLALGALALGLVVAAPALGASGGAAVYRTFGGLDSRTVVWVVAELHLMFAAFVLGVPIFAVILELVGVRSGDAARVRSRVGELVAPVEVTDAIRPGVVSLPHGWGHDEEGARLSVARQRPGTNSNVLTDELEMDPLSGTSVLNSIPVTVEAAGV